MKNWTDEKYQKILISIFSTIAVVAATILLAGKFNSKSKMPEVCFGKNCFDVEIADSKEERVRGLMFREKLEEGKGMLFIFEQEDIHSFWMKNTRISLDIIWISKDKEIVFISKNAQPCKGGDACPTINPEKSALYVLEINAGLVDKTGVKIGDKADFKI